MRRSIVLAALLVPHFAAALPTSRAHADPPANNPPLATGPAVAASPAPTAGPYALAIQEGYAKLREGDSHAAQLAFQRATTADATKSEGHYLLGIAMLRNDSHEPAAASFRAALERAQAASDLMGEARARIGLVRALTLVSREHHRTNHHSRDASAANAAQARTDLIVFATAHPDILSPDLPRAELAASDAVRDLATRMEPVRERIAAREREARAHPAARSTH